MVPSAAIVILHCVFAVAKATTTGSSITITSPSEEATIDSTTSEIEFSGDDDLFSTSTPFVEFTSINSTISVPGMTTFSATTTLGTSAANFERNTTQQLENTETTSDTNTQQTSNALSTAPLSDIGVDDDDDDETGDASTTNSIRESSPVSAQSSATAVQTALSSDPTNSDQQSFSTPLPTTTTTTTTATITTITSRVTLPQNDIETTRAGGDQSENPDTSTVVDVNVSTGSSPAKTECTNDRDCDSNQHCVNNESSNTCACKPGYSEGSNQLCIQKVRQFGNKIQFRRNSGSDGNVDTTPMPLQTYREVAERMINNAYGPQSWFRKFNILEITDDPVSVSYELITEDDPSINSSLIKSTFMDFIANDSTFPNGCSCDQEECIIENLIMLAALTCEDTGQVQDILCELSEEISQYCNKESTTCSASDDGKISCPCIDGYIRNTETSCLKFVCANDIECNSPHGSCDTTQIAGECSCNWGFEGTNCEEPWLLVMTILLSVLAVVLIGGVIYLIVKYRKQLKKRKTADEPEIPEQKPKDGYRKENEKYNASPWDDGPVRPKSFKRTGTVSPALIPAAMAVSNPETSAAAQHAVQIQREESRVAPTEAEVFNIRNVARNRRSALRSPQEPQRSEFDFLLPNQTPEL